MAAGLAGMEVLEDAQAPRPPPRVWLQGGADAEAVGSAIARAFGSQGVVFGHGEASGKADVLLLALGLHDDVRARVEAAIEAGHRVVVIGASEEQHAQAIRSGARGFVLGPSPSPVRLASAILAALPGDRSVLPRMKDDRFRRIAEEATDMVSVHDPEGVYTYVSPSCRKLLGHDPEDLLGHSAYEFFHPDDLERIQASHQAVKEAPAVYVVRYRIRRKDGSYTWFETTSKTIRDAGGAIREILAHSRDISRRIEEQEAREQAVVDRAAEERERAIKAYRRSLLNAAGHGLRTPLTPMRLQLASLQKAVLPERHARSVDLVARNVERLGEAIEGFLELARIHTDAAEFDVGTMDLARCAELAVGRAGPRAAENGIVLTVEADAPAMVEADNRHMGRILDELLDNAIAACGKGSHIAVRVVSEGKEVRCSVEDDGVGFAPDAAEGLFEPFQTGDRPGRGLGLAIVRALLGRQGGHIIAHSDGTGQGARFTIGMPRSKAAAPRATEGLAQVRREDVQDAPASMAPARR